MKVKIVIGIVILAIALYLIFFRKKNKADQFDGFGRRGGGGGYRGGGSRNIIVASNPYLYPPIYPVYEGEDPKDKEIRELKEKLNKKS